MPACLSTVRVRADIPLNGMPTLYSSTFYTGEARECSLRPRLVWGPLIILNAGRTYHSRIQELPFRGGLAMFDHDIREFASPLDPTGDPPAKSPKPVVVTIPGLNEDRALTLAFEELRKMPVPRRNLLIGHLMALLKMHAADCAAIARCAQPYLSDAQLGVLVNRSERQVRRYFEEMRAADMDDAISRLRRKSYRDDDPRD
jgi:hypothetical protein